jgi:hypothetical protein
MNIEIHKEVGSSYGSSVPSSHLCVRNSDFDVSFNRLHGWSYRCVYKVR